MSRIGELLVREKMLSLQQLQQAQEEAKRTGKRLGATLSRLGYVKDQELTQFVAKQYSLPSINLAEIEIEAGVLKLVPREICEKHQVIPVRRNGPTLIVAMADPANIYAIDELKFLTQYNIEPVVASESQLEAALTRYYDKGPDLDQMMGEFDVDNVDYASVSDDAVNVVDLENQAGEAPVVKLVNAIMLSAIKKKASDIHVEPYEKSFRVRSRIDGILQEEMRPPLKLRNAITSASRSWRPSTSPSAASRRTDASSSRSARTRRWTSASASCRRCTARRSSCVSSTRAPCSST